MPPSSLTKLKRPVGRNCNSHTNCDVYGIPIHLNSHQLLVSHWTKFLVCSAVTNFGLNKTLQS